MADIIIEEIKKNVDAENREKQIEQILKKQSQNKINQVSSKNIEWDKTEREEEIKKSASSLLLNLGISTIYKSIAEGREFLKEEAIAFEKRIEYEKLSKLNESFETVNNINEDILFKTFLQSINLKNIYPQLIQTFRVNRWLALYEFPESFIKEIINDEKNISLIEDTLLALTSLTRKITIPSYGFELKTKDGGLPIKIELPHYIETFKFGENISIEFVDAKKISQLNTLFNEKTSISIESLNFFFRKFADYVTGLKEFKKSVSDIKNFLNSHITNPLLPIDSSILIKIILFPEFSKQNKEIIYYIYNILAIPNDIDTIQLSYDSTELLPLSIDCKILYSNFDKKIIKIS